MKFRTNLAYKKTNLQRQKQNKIVKHNHIGRIYRNRVRVRLKFYIFSIIAASAFLSAFILSLVKSNEITAILNLTKKELQIQTSENIRLKTQLEQKINFQKIEKYAQENLHMRRLNNSQITVLQNKNIEKIEPNQKNKQIGATGPQNKHKKNLLNNILNKIKKLFKN